MNNYNFFRIADGQIYNISNFKGDPDIIGIYIPISINQALKEGNIDAVKSAYKRYEFPFRDDFDFLIKNKNKLTKNQKTIAYMFFENGKFADSADRLSPTPTVYFFPINQMTHNINIRNQLENIFFDDKSKYEKVVKILSPLSLNESIRTGNIDAYRFALDEFNRPPMLDDFQYIISLDSLTHDQKAIVKMMIKGNKVGIKESDERYWIIKEYPIIKALSFDDRYKLASDFLKYKYKEKDTPEGIAPIFYNKLEKERLEILDILGIEDTDSCKSIMCEEKIRNKKDYHKWLTKNHPDKAGENNDKFKLRFEQLRDCVKENKYCDINDNDDNDSDFNDQD
jgi:hypothetical protein